ncbi:iron complex transport system ATP-binding protein [Scopulibacillus darangshiensis]|uniref:Iron complex transport system ATP-binding protein n=1 Tax=Scopulibacillus darangshiensis TaxID=442528 RepID=A0A4R2NWK3_9BACL|nr:ABC transporter ATP-binding protein [Scopulibacillus darangshiensis]TCP25971.1 iron complex transport system ATP-binding protein [Scopulibacillus darangshiensis]
MLIDIENVHLIKNRKRIINDISWQVEEGQHWAILGMNGAGKTTLLNLVCGYHFPSKGTMKVFGKQFGRYPLHDLRKQIGWVSFSFSEKMAHHLQNSGLQVILSGKFASIGLYEQPDDKDIDKAKEIMDQLGIARLKNQPYADMSQGEKQRVLIGRALMAEPRLLILDEPCSGLDFLSKEQLLKTVEQMADRRKTTIIYVTHQIDEILPIFTHTLLLREGGNFSQGPTEEQLTSENLSHFCKTPINVHQKNRRFSLELKQDVTV